MSLFEELKRRNVFRVGIAYVLMAWVLLQAGDFALDLVDAPNWIIQSLFIIALIGLPVALFFAWAFEVTPEGIKREADVDRTQSIAPTTGRKLDRAIIVFLALAVVLLLGERFWLSGVPREATEVAADQGALSSNTGAQPLAESSGPALPTDTIAVLPFANRSNKEEDLFFTDGMHDDLLTQLARVDGLKVISRTSVMSYRDTDLRIPQIAAVLGAGIILEGGVQRAGDRVRINAQLIDVATDQHLWADTFDREMTIDNLFDIQSEISRQIVAAVKGTVSADDIRSLGERPTDSLDAWEAYLRARAILSETDYEIYKYRRAEPFVELAIEADPGFLEAWVVLAEIQLQGIWGGGNNTPAQREAARASIDKAIGLDPDNPAVLAARAEYEYRANYDYQSSLELIDRAIERVPGFEKYHQHRGLSLRRLGRLEEAVTAFDRAIALDPLSSNTAAIQAETLAFMKDWERLEPLLEKWLPMHPDSFDLLYWKFRLLIDHYGNLDAARALLTDARLVSGSRLLMAFEEQALYDRDWTRALEVVQAPENQGFMPVLDMTDDYRVGRIYALMGQAETASGYLNRYLENARQEQKHGSIAQAIQAANIAEAHALLGEYEQAVQYARLADATIGEIDDVFWGRLVDETTTRVLAMAGLRDEALNRLGQRIQQPGHRGQWSIYLNPAWDFFRDDPRFNDLVRPPGIEPQPFLQQDVKS